MDSYTPMQRRILDILSDGLAHRLSDMAVTLDMDRVVLRKHVSILRRKMPRGFAILCEVGQGQVKSYRHVRLLASPVE